MSTSPTPWFYTIETAGKVPRCILRNNDGEFIGLIDRTEDAEVIVKGMHQKINAGLIQALTDLLAYEDIRPLPGTFGAEVYARAEAALKLATE
jgi:hypothetical protein